MPITQEISDMFDIGHKPFQTLFTSFPKLIALTFHMAIQLGENAGRFRVSLLKNVSLNAAMYMSNKL